MTCFQYDTSICAISPCTGTGKCSEFRTKSKIKPTLLQVFLKSGQLFGVTLNMAACPFVHGTSSREKYFQLLLGLDVWFSRTMSSQAQWRGWQSVAEIWSVRRDLSSPFYHQCKDTTEVYKGSWSAQLSSIMELV